MENIYKIVYLNLEARKDRNEVMIREFEKYGIPLEKVVRFNSIPFPEFGTVGCGRSHLGALKLARENGWKNVLILEDDFEIDVTKEKFYEELDYFFNKFIADGNKRWDVFMIGYNTNNPDHRTEELPLSESDENRKRYGIIRYAQSAGSYLVNGHYFDELINNIEEGNKKLLETRIHWHYANDVYWRSLQARDIWYYPKRRLGVQRRSYPENRFYFC